MIKRILLALGGTPYSPVAISHAVELAGIHGAEITAVPVLATDHWKYRLGPLSSASEAARLWEGKPWVVSETRLAELLQGFEKACSMTKIPCRIKRTTADPLELLIHEWRYHDLVIFGLRGLFDYGVVPDPEEAIARLIREGVQPILAVASRRRPIRRGMVAYDGSLESTIAMKRFVQMKLWPHVRIAIVSGHRDQSVAAELLAEAAAYCTAHDVVPETQWLPDARATHLLEHAHQTNTDLLVLGDGFRTTILGRKLGKTVSELIREADLPLLLSH